jgi:rhodanese-related sulfurtransferase
VVVTSVTSTKEGRIERVDVLESPDADTAAAVRAALAQWTIPAPQLVDRPTSNLARVKMTFYFQIRNGKGVVLAPDQMPGNEDVFAAFNRPPAGRNVSGAAPAPPPVVVQHSGTAREIDEVEFTRLITSPNAVILDVRDREQFASGAHPRARNMPFSEVGTRSRAELPVNATVVIDCSRSETSRCHMAHDSLRNRGFKDVAVYIP